MNVIVQKSSSGVKYVKIVESYRHETTKKPRYRVIKNLGRLDELLKEDPNFLENLKADLAEKRVTNPAPKTISDSLNVFESIFKDEDIETKKLNYGCLIHRHFWKNLKLNLLLKKLSKSTKLKFDIENLLWYLSMVRIIEPCSKRKSYLNADKYVINPECNLNNYYRSLDFIYAHKDSIEQHLHREISKKTNRKMSVAFYDVTTYYIESTDVSEIKNFGYSKDNKLNQVQVVMGLLIDENAIPVTYRLFPGNTQDASTLKPFLIELKEKFNVSDVIITADRGLNSKSNIKMIRELGFSYLVAYKIRSSTKIIKDEVLNDSDYKYLSDDLKYKEYYTKREVKSDGEKYLFEEKLLMTHSRRRAEKDRIDRERLINKSVKLSESPALLKTLNKRGGKKYLTITQEKAELNHAQIELDEQFDGYYAISTSKLDLEPKEILNIYRGLWKIEDSFRTLKTNLESRPMYHYTDKRIEGHFLICFISLVIERYMQYLMKANNYEITVNEIKEALSEADLVKMSKGKKEYFRILDHNILIEKLMEVSGMKRIPANGVFSMLKS